MSESLKKDKWELDLDKHLEILRKCQYEYKVDSCLKCENILDCQTRENYVVAVYESMNKGSGGGFEF